MNIVIGNYPHGSHDLGISHALVFRMKGYAQRTTNLRKHVDS